MKIPLWQVDAFSNSIFGGNPAAVCLLTQWLPDEIMRKIAAENNLAETAFVCRENLGWAIRWFTPTVEVDLCGHATLAAAAVLFSEKMVEGNEIHFHSRSGVLRVFQKEAEYVLDFPARPPKRIQSWPGVEEALGVNALEFWRARDLLVLLRDEEQVENMRPDINLLAGIDVFAVCVTAPGSKVDFVSRFFAPKQGIAEDPVTGSAHCSLVPFWAARLGRQDLRARQLSKRGGDLNCSLKGERVEIAGSTALFMRGEIFL